MGFDMNYKIKVANEAENKEVQCLFNLLGYTSGSAFGLDTARWLFAEDGIINYASTDEYDEGDVIFKEITLPELRDLVVLKRNSIDDATHEDKDDHRFKYRLINNHWHVITEENPAWRKDSIDLNDAPLFMKPIEKKEMKEYLEKQPDGSYVMKSGFALAPADWIEIPEGAECLTICQGFMAFWKKGAVFFLNGENGWDRSYETGVIGYLYLHKSKGCVIIWQRESPNDKLASAEQYRQAEVLPFIDDEPKNVDLASGCDLDELAKEYGFRDRDIGESCLCYRESLKIFIARDKSREWDLSDYDFAESDAWIESNIEQDNVNNPSHYADSAIECIDAMQAMLTPEQFIGYLRGNIFKYQWRYEKKNGIEDLKKSQWYLDKLISAL